MKITIFDVSNGSCALAVCADGYSIMFDCGSHSEKDCPVERIYAMNIPNSWLSHMKNFTTESGISYPLTKLVISHRDLDHNKY
jgi:glyoxylase-like metal-dependent hydrolase (beta-lactamase superfamily II)